MLDCRSPSARHRPPGSAVLAFAKLTRSQETWAVHWSEVKFDGPSLKAVIVQGLPSGIQNSVISIANVIVQSNINSFGAQAMAGCGAYSKVEGFAFLPVTCFAMALACDRDVGDAQQTPDRQHDHHRHDGAAQTAQDARAAMAERQQSARTSARASRTA